MSIFKRLIVNGVAATTLVMAASNIQADKRPGDGADAAEFADFGTGALPMTPEKEAEIEKKFVERDYCPPTKIGLERINRIRAKKGLPALTMEEAAEQAKKRGRQRRERLRKELKKRGKLKSKAEAVDGEVEK